MPYSTKTIEGRFKRKWNPFSKHVVSEAVRPSFFSQQCESKDGEIEVLKFELNEGTWTSVTNIRIVGKIDAQLSEVVLEDGEFAVSFLDENQQRISSKEYADAIFFVHLRKQDAVFFVQGIQAFALANTINHLVPT